MAADGRFWGVRDDEKDTAGEWRSARFSAGPPHLKPAPPAHWFGLQLPTLARDIGLLPRRRLPAYRISQTVSCGLTGRAQSLFEQTLIQDRAAGRIEFKSHMLGVFVEERDPAAYRGMDSDALEAGRDVANDVR